MRKVNSIIIYEKREFREKRENRIAFKIQKIQKSIKNKNNQTTYLDAMTTYFNAI